MADIRLRVGGLNSITTFTKTEQEIGQILLWFISDFGLIEPTGLSQTELNQWRLDTATKKIIMMIRAEARTNRLRLLRAEQRNIEERAESETSTL